MDREYERNKEESRNKIIVSNCSCCGVCLLGAAPPARGANAALWLNIVLLREIITFKFKVENRRKAFFETLCDDI
jgi:hypothetical protein